MKTNESHDYEVAASALSYPLMAYQFDFALGPFNLAQVLVPTVHVADQFPTKSMYFSPQTKRFDFSVAEIKTNNFFYLSYQYFKNQRLPAPYATNCLDYYATYYQQTQCSQCTQARFIDRCLIDKTVKEMGLFPFSVIIDEQQKTANKSRPLVTYKNFRGNATFNAYLRSLEESCAQLFPSPGNCVIFRYLFLIA